MTKRIIGDDKARLESYLDKSGGSNACWPFTGAKNSHGYGNFWLNGRYTSSHRASYQLFIGQIPEDKVVDHICHNVPDCPGGRLCAHRSCSNPRHLVLTEHGTNVLRGAGPPSDNSRKTHCDSGHEFNQENTYIIYRKSTGRTARGCRTCHADRERARRLRHKNEMVT